jgi:hypothetical protein
MQNSNVIYLDFQHRAAMPIQEHHPARGGGRAVYPCRGQLLASSVYHLVASVTFALCCWLANVAYLLAIWL